MCVCFDIRNHYSHEIAFENLSESEIEEGLEEEKAGQFLSL